MSKKTYNRMVIIDKVIDLCSDSELKYMMRSIGVTLTLRNKGNEKQVAYDDMLENINRMTYAKTQLEKDMIDLDQQILVRKL